MHIEESVLRLLAKDYSNVWRFSIFNLFSFVLVGFPAHCSDDPRGNAPPSFQWDIFDVSFIAA